MRLCKLFKAGQAFLIADHSPEKYPLIYKENKSRFLKGVSIGFLQLLCKFVQGAGAGTFVRHSFVHFFAYPVVPANQKSTFR